MDYLTNPFILALVAGTLTFGVTYVYLKKSISKDSDESPDLILCAKNGCLTLVSALMVLGYLNYAHSQTEQATLTTEFFQTGQPKF